MQAPTEPLTPLPVQSPLFFQNQGHNTLAPPSGRQGLFAGADSHPSILSRLRCPRPFDDAMLRLVIRDQNDEQFDRLRLSSSSMCFALQFQKP